jgi:hypothetical protein
MYKRLTITFTAAERAALERLAQQDTRPIKDQVRALVRAEAERRHLWLDDPTGPRQAVPPAGSWPLGRPAAPGIEPETGG